MSIRLSGLSSNMDTDSIVKELVKANRKKVEDLKKDQTKLGWQQEAWKTVNSKVYSFYTGALSKLRFAANYKAKKTTSSDESVIKMASGTGSVNGVQSATVSHLAKSAYLTGGEIKAADGTKLTSESKIQDIDGMSGLTGSFYIKGGEGAAYTEITIDENTTIKDLTAQLNKAGVAASFDEANGRMFISAQGTGKKNDFGLYVKDAGGSMVAATPDNSALLGGLKLVGDQANKDAAQDAQITLNGATFTSSSNTFTVNNMTFTVQKESSATVFITTADDYDGMYNMIKGLIKDYNSLMKDLDSLYNADAAKGYEPLTDDERAEMSDKEIEEWEKKIKDSILRNDSTMGSFATSIYSTMSSTLEVNGKKLSLSSFGISTMSYFLAGANEKRVFHIDGDVDDESVSSKTNLLKDMITSDPEGTISFFEQLTRDVYAKMDEVMKEGNDFKSMFKVNNDKQMQKEYDTYKDKIKQEEKKLAEYEQRWYDKFTAMETALSKLTSKESALSSILGS